MFFFDIQSFIEDWLKDKNRFPRKNVTFNQEARGKEILYKKPKKCFPKVIDQCDSQQAMTEQGHARSLSSKLRNRQLREDHSWGGRKGD